jgi:hypothetical protein
MKWHIVKRDETINYYEGDSFFRAYREGQYAIISHEDSMEGEETYGSFDDLQQARAECHELSKISSILES